MNAAQFKALLGMLPARRGPMTLLFDSSRDGGVTPAAFHRLCDGRGKDCTPSRAVCWCVGETGCICDTGHTVVVIRDAEGSICGGYADVAWTSRTGVCAPSTVAFLFCLVSSKSPGAAAFQMRLSGASNQHAMYHHSSYGPFFGGNDLYVHPNGTVYYTMGTTYRAGPLGASPSRASTVKVDAMEVWALADA